MKPVSDSEYLNREAEEFICTCTICGKKYDARDGYCCPYCKRFNQ